MTPAARILVVDDDPALRDLLCAYLTDTGFVVDLAGDGEAMRRAMQLAMPDAIVLDLMLPNELKVFIERPNRVLSRDLLLDLLKGYERDPYDRTVDIRVARLRRKIEPDPTNPVYVRTLRGAGYLFNPRGADS